MRGKAGRRRGTIEGRGNRRWLVRVSLGTDAQGKRVVLNRTVHGTKLDAERVLTDLLQRSDAGGVLTASRQKLGDWLNEWLAQWTRDIRLRTRLDYESLTRLHVPAWLSVKPLDRLTPSDLQRWVAELEGKGLSPRRVRYAHAVVRAALVRAEKLQKIGRNPARLVDLPRQTRRTRRVLTPAEAVKFLASCEGEPLGALFGVLLTGGLRPSEALGLRWEDVDFETGLVRVERGLTWLRKHADSRQTYEIADPKTPTARRAVPLPKIAMRLLQSHRRAQAEMRLRAGSDWENMSLVFTNERGRPQDLDNVRRRDFARVLKKTGIVDPLRLYDLRHSAASLLLADNVHPKIVQERLGHASITLTLGTYSHLLATAQERAVETLDRMFAGTVSSAN